MKLSVDIAVGKFKPTKQIDFPTNEFVDLDEFLDNYSQYCTDLLPEQDILKIIAMLDLNITREIGNIHKQPSIGFNGMVVEDTTFYTFRFWIDKSYTIWANCNMEITFNLFADENHKLTSKAIYDMLYLAIKKAIAKSGASRLIGNSELTF